MSAMPAIPATTSPAPRPSRLSRAGAALHLVPGTRPRLGGGPFAAVVVGILAGGLLTLLLLNTVIAQGAFTVNQRQAQADALAVQEQALAQRVAALETPDALERRARELGMVASTTPVFLRLSDGKVLGVPTPASGRRSTTSVREPARDPKPVAAVPAPEAAEEAAAGDGAAGAAGDGAAAVPPPEGAEEQAAADAAAAAEADAADAAAPVGDGAAATASSTDGPRPSSPAPSASAGRLR